MAPLGTGCAVYSIARRVKGVAMSENDVCHFLGKNDDYCDVGCGYVSTHDAYMMVRYCDGRYELCAKFHELSDRLRGEVVTMPSYGHEPSHI